MKDSHSKNRQGCERFLALLNAKEINTEFIDSLITETRTGIWPTMNIDHISSAEELSQLREELLGLASLISMDVDFEAAKKLVEWASEEWGPSFTISEDYRVRTENDSTRSVESIEEAIAVEILETFSEISFIYFKQCMECQKFFLARNSNKRYCSKNCVDQHDRNQNRPKYAKSLKSRRIGSKYVPLSYFLCEKCHLPVHKKNGIEKLERIKCPHCKKDIINHFHWGR